MAHAFITIPIRFNKHRIFNVNEAIAALANPDEGNRPRQKLADALDRVAIIHYMSIVVVGPVCPATESEDPLHRDRENSDFAHLMIEITGDGGVDEVLAVLDGALGPEIAQVLDAAQVDRKGRSVAQFLRKRYWKIDAGWTAPALGQIHMGSPGMSVRRIRQERDLAAFIAERIDQYQKDDEWLNRSPRQRLEWIRSDVWSWTHKDWGDTKWAFVEEPAPVLPGDPANKWNDSGYHIGNPQALKAFAWILHTLLWPLYLPFALAWYFLARPAWNEATAESVLWTAAVFGGLLVVVILCVGFVFARLRGLEKKDHVDERVPTDRQVGALMRQENYFPGAQNHMATISRLKRGWVRRLTLRIAFIVVGSGRFVGAPGYLGKNGVIHAARWMRLPGTNQLLFWSNFDNTWESYVADFIADAPSGVTAIWSNCLGFPRTDTLFLGGAEDHNKLVPWARRQQTPTLFWYSAYPDLTADRIRNNAAIRQGLASAASDADSRDWLALFGSAVRPVRELDLTEIPTLAFGGLSNRPFAQCQIVRFGDKHELAGNPKERAAAVATAARSWLSLVSADVTFGETKLGQHTAVAVALSASALRSLGVPAETLATFPPAFQQGMWPEWRARELGDIGRNAPETWTWGGNDTDQRADAMVLIYAMEEQYLVSKSGEFTRKASEEGHSVTVVPLTMPSPSAPDGEGRAAATSEPGRTGKAGGASFPREPFGFADGVSQPIIRGAPRKKTRASDNDLVAPGEILLGYPDNTGLLPHSPSLAAMHDEHHYLPDRGPDPFRRRPEFSRYEGVSGERDLGANGTFLVVRQLDQDQHAFTTFLNETFKTLRSIYRMTSYDGAVTIEAKPAWGAGHHGGTLASLQAHPSDPGSIASTSIGTSGSPPPMTVAGDSMETDPPDEQTVKDFLAAKMVGRWQDGSSLVRNPQVPASRTNPNARPDNAFLLGEEDPRGLACPFGSHIRRANPRDTRFHSTALESRTEIEGVNRHRILRVGRGYRYQNGDGPVRTGLLFMCLNANIERQFEFIQKTWLLNRNIQRLQDEPDPVLSSGERSFTIPTPSGPVRIPINRDFVTMTGGGYFFMPGLAALRYLTRGALVVSDNPFAAPAQAPL